jgi:hypothetical protein
MASKQGSPALTVTRGREYNPTPRVVKVTPQFAEALLNNNRLNRPLRPGRVERYARDMAAGNWQMNGETIKVTRDGDLLDGQHRLFAVIESGATVSMLFVEGLSADVMPTIDTGAPRSFSDVLSIGKRTNTTVVAAALRWLYWYESKPRPASNATSKPTHSELAQLLGENPDVVERASEIASTKRARRLVPTSVLCFVYTMAHRIDPARAGAWLGLLESGAEMDAKHPVHQLRERMLSNATSTAKLPPLDVCALTVKSWNQYITGKRTNVLRWTSAESFPDFARSGR